MLYQRSMGCHGRSGGVALVVASVVTVAVVNDVSAADLLWDNDIECNGFNGRAISPPTFPDIRVADDFTIEDGDRWIVQGLRVHVLEDGGWTRGDVLTVYVYEDADGAPGPEIDCRTGAFEWTLVPPRCKTFGRDTYKYWIEFEDVPLEAGRYWVGVRNPNGGGQGTNYWLTSHGGPDGAGTETAWFSLDAGGSWIAAGAGWQHAFQIRGICGCPECDADYDGDCAVTFNDLLVLLSLWGPCTPSNDCFDQDLDGDRAITFDDLLLLLAAWGPCDS